MQLASSKYGVRLLEQDCCDSMKFLITTPFTVLLFRRHVYGACHVSCNFQKPTSYDKTRSKKRNVSKGYICVFTQSLDLHGTHFTKFQGVMLLILNITKF